MRKMAKAPPNCCLLSNQNSYPSAVTLSSNNYLSSRVIFGISFVGHEAFATRSQLAIAMAPLLSHMSPYRSWESLA